MKLEKQRCFKNFWRAAISSSLLFLAVHAEAHQEIICSRSKEDLKLRISIIEIQKIPTLVRWGLYYSGQLLENTQGEGPWQAEEPASNHQSASTIAPFSAFDNNSAISYHDNMAVYLYSDNTAIAFDCL